MWILESEGDFLDGKRVWLRPGKKYLFGRVKQADVRHVIDHRTISRKHVVIEVSPVKTGDGSHIYAKSEISVIDQESKYGTIVDGEQIKGTTKKLTGDEHSIQLGKYQHALRIKWKPTVLSFSFSSKELKARDPLARVRSRLEDLDVKTIIPYVIGATTHVVQSKRNTAKGLQALVNGGYIVQESFIDALVYAATPSDVENFESLSPLEADFDAAWPDAREHLPPPGKEVVTRSEESFAPDPERINIFEGYTFVFGDPGQYENLQDPINNGHGKALLHRVEDGVTTAGEIVQFMKNAAGQKGLGSEREGRGGVVLVRFRSKGEWEDWSLELGNQVAVMTDQRVIEQSEFLDAILRNDASVLCRPLRKVVQEMDVDSPPESASAPPPSSEDVQVVADSQPSEEVSQPSKKVKSTRVRNYVSKMKTFDDGFDINSIPAYAPEVEECPESLPPTSIDEAPSGIQSQQVDSFQEEEDMVSSLLPGARAMKRLRAETSQRSVNEPLSRPKPEEAPRPKRQKLDVLEAARQHREAEEDAARQRRLEEEESLQNALRDVDVEKLKGLAIVEDMEVPTKKAVNDDDRWDERWNGRKNFKKFRRKGDSDQSRRGIQAVIVPLEEVAQKDFGIGDHYWVSTHRSVEQSATESQQERVASREAAEVSQPISLARSEPERTSSERASAQSQKRVREEQDSDSEDELRFRFRRRR